MADEAFDVSDRMIKQIEILPVTSDEAVNILGSLNMEELQHLLDEIRISRKYNLPILRQKSMDNLTDKPNLSRQTRTAMLILQDAQSSV